MKTQTRRRDVYVVAAFFRYMTPVNLVYSDDDGCECGFRGFVCLKRRRRRRSG